MTRSLTAIMEELLSKSGKPMQVGDILQKVEDAGYHSRKREFPRDRESDADQGQAFHVGGTRAVSA